MTSEKRDIPEPIKRIVRQECYFGCAICGCPVFDYHHIIDYAIVKEHNADNIVLLCRNHHTSKHSGKLSNERVQEAKINPYNKSREFTSPYKIDENRTIDIKVGSNTSGTNFNGQDGIYSILWINGFSYFTIHSENNWLTISFVLTDNSGNPILQAYKGEMQVFSGVWDYTYEGTTLLIRKGLGNIILKLTLSNYEVKIDKGMFLSKSLDGFVIQNDMLLEYCEGNNYGTSIGCRSSNNRNGGWGILNYNIAPKVEKMGGFGIFRTFGNK